jgi:hypothetical protein
MDWVYRKYINKCLWKMGWAGSENINWKRRHRN